MRKTYYFSVPDALSSGEQEITRLTCIGWSNKQIAERLNLKVEAVQVHLNGIFCKVGVKSRTELVAVLVKRLRSAYA
jgi:DNA-binding NarL/FixJ family response regulator